MKKKQSLLSLYSILSMHSDENHPITRKEIDRYLALEYDITIDRKTLHDHIELLNEFGCDIQSATSSHDGYYMGQRLFNRQKFIYYAMQFFRSFYTRESLKRFN